ncbi:MAG: acylphosphatase, partial [Acidobacteriota bacterium]
MRLMLTRRCIVKGRVQGVGFRYFTCRIAKDVGIKGWVRNL